ncbi:Luciferase-type oxidoreductase [Pararobbsia alpina]|uniref:TIGR03571 family LLM class oxidoreductase n=1 Tax=Pararobbsia alpina TaxID=621374 RepID=UPI0039A6D5EA
MSIDVSEESVARVGAARLFCEGRISFGLTLPVGVFDAHDVDYAAQVRLAKLAESHGFDALWVRDVPLNNEGYPDPVGHLDPWVLLGALATHTQSITLVTGAIVLTLRHPLHIAKGAVSVAALSGGRFVLGLGSGDRPPEFAAFGRDTEARRELFRANWERVEAALAPTPVVIPDIEADPPTTFELRPRAPAPVPMLSVGSSGQSVDWIARHSIGWATYHRPPAAQHDRHAMWRAAVKRAAPDAFRSFSVAMRVELVDQADAPAEPIELGYRAGRRALRDVLSEVQEMGAHHVTFNLHAQSRPTEEVIEELARDILPMRG